MDFGAIGIVRHTRLQNNNVTHFNGVQVPFVEFEQIRIGNVNIHLNKTYLYLGLIILTTPVIFYSSPISTLISLSSISGGIIITHGLLIDNLPETSFNESVV